MIDFFHHWWERLIKLSLNPIDYLMGWGIETFSCWALRCLFFSKTDGSFLVPTGHSQEYQDMPKLQRYQFWLNFCVYLYLLNVLNFVLQFVGIGQQFLWGLWCSSFVCYITDASTYVLNGDRANKDIPNLRSRRQNAIHVPSFTIGLMTWSWF